ncbi:MAG: DUF2326 domain-containing protein [Coriobacteriaceae bacterium]|nr:DUF2326 domain-containing protein [Coriobacteriaceae bacterium]
MLVEISCSKFVDQGIPRGTISFKPGLNAVLGAERANNSIGKTTFLLVIDFCFGGSSYATINGDIKENVGEHVIKFAHSFFGTTHYFSRSFRDYKSVCVCNKRYEPIKTVPLKEFNAWLQEQCELPSEDATFRDLFHGFARIYGLNNDDEKLPLKANEGDSAEKGILRLLKLYGLYPEISALEKNLAEAEDDKKVFYAAMRHQLVMPAANKKDYQQNAKKALALRGEKAELAARDHDNLVDLEPLVAERVALLKKTLANLRRRKTRLKRTLESIEDERSFGSYKQGRDFEDFRRLFPEADIRSIEEIEGFHKKLSGLLEKERKESASVAQLQIRALEEEISALEEEVKKAGVVSNLSAAVLDAYAALDKEIAQLESANDLYDKKTALDEKVKERRDLLGSRKLLLLGTMQTQINAALATSNSEVCGAEKTAPVLSLEGPKRYTFGIANDHGTGSLTRAMFLFDFAVLEQTNLPAIIHDSHLIKQVEDDSVVSLLEMYDRTKKQVFVAIDKGHSYSSEGMPAVLENSVILRLDRHHELFGRAWNEKPEEE